jgi:hypothetical protein
MEMVPRVGAVSPWQGRGGKDPGRRPPRDGARDAVDGEPDGPTAAPASGPEPDPQALLEALDRMVAVQPPADEDTTRIIRGRRAYRTEPLDQAG